MARSAVDCGAMLGVIAGQDPKDTTSVPLPVPDYLAGLSGDLRGVTIGVDRRWTSEGTDDAAAKVLGEGLRVAADLGAKIKEITFPDPKAVIDDWFPLCGIEAAVAHEATYPSRKDEYGPALAGLLDLGRQQSGMDYQKIVLRREAFRGAVRAAVRDGRSHRGAGPGLRRAHARQDGVARRGRIADRRTAALHLPVRHDGKPDDHAARRLRRRTAVRSPSSSSAATSTKRSLVRAGDAFQRVTDWHKRHPAL